MPSPTRDELIDRARSLAPLLAEHARPSEELRHPTDEVMAAIESAQIFELMVPRCYGGLELDMDTFVEVVLALSEGDASLGWVTSFLIEHNWMFCQFPERFQKELFAERSYVLAPGMIAPSGRARPVRGGAVLSGRWPFATGVWHSSWVIAGGLLQGEDGLPDPRFFAVPREEVSVEDTWHVDGMCATGSHDVVIEECFVPEERSVSILAMSRGRAPGSEIHAGPLYRTPMIPLLATAASMPALGRARAVVREFGARLPGRKRMGMGPSQAERTPVQIRLARLSIAAHQAELLLRDTVRELCALRDGAQPADRARLQAQLATVVDQSKHIVGDACEASGAGAHQLADPLQRARRDLDVIACHVIFDLEMALENTGKALLGLELPPMT